MALFMLQRYPHIKYTIIDVPPAIDVAKRFLNGKFDVQFISPKESESFFLSKIDLFYTSSVLSELGREKVRFYFNLVNKYGKFFYLKNLKWGHHRNDLPFLVWFFLRIADKLSWKIKGKKSLWVRGLARRYSINENSYPKMGWEELLHQNCETVTGHASQSNIQAEWGFFEVVYKIRSSFETNV
ncbi:MAG: hypothetical protein Q8N88_02815 [Nanoarchaeota archaeon]|nr:hypothetical protein [Nanoarchaeota archaeon]